MPARSSGSTPPTAAAGPTPLIPATRPSPARAGPNDRNRASTFTGSGRVSCRAAVGGDQSDDRAGARGSHRKGGGAGRGPTSAARPCRSRAVGHLGASRGSWRVEASRRVVDRGRQPRRRGALMESERGISLLSRRDALKVAAGAAVAPLVAGRAVGAQGEATPAGDEGFFPSPIEGVPNAYYRYPEPFKTVSQVPGSGSTVKLALLSDKRIKGRDENAYWQELEA